MATVVNREAPYSGLANLMAMRGRMGDTELVHMSPSEIKGLASLGQLTVNPDTGLPEAFSLKSILPTVAGIGAAVATGGTSLLIPALATGLTSAVVNKDIGRGLFDGLLSYAGGSIMKGLTAGTPVDPTKAVIEPAAGSIGQVTPAQAATQASQNFGAALQQPAQGSLLYNPPIQGPLTASQMAVAGPGGFAVPSMPTVGAYTPPASPFVYAQDVKASGLQKALGLAADKTAGQAATGLEAFNAGVGDFSQLTGLEKAKFIGMRAAPGIAGAALESAMTPEYPQPELLSGTVSTPRTPRTITRTPLRSTPVTQEEALAAATGTGPALRFSDYTTRFANQGGLVGLATGGGIRPIEEAGDPSNDPQGNVGTGVVGNVNVTDPVDIGLGAFNPSPLSLGLGLVGLAMGVPGLGLASSMIGTPNVNALGQTQVSGVGNQSVDSFGNVVGTTQADIASMSAAPATVGVTPGLQDPMGVFGDFTSSGDGVGGMGGEDTGSGDQGDTGVGHGAGEGTSEEGAVATGGLIGALAAGGRPYFEGMVPGTAHGMKDNVAFKVQGGNIDTAMLSPGEYVIPADVVAMLGNGNGDSGAKELDAFAKSIRQKAFGTKKQQKQINAPKELGQLATA